MMIIIIILFTDGALDAVTRTHYSPLRVRSYKPYTHVSYVTR